MEDKNIQFTIVLPVHNGGEYIKKCIDSILKQSYRKFELLILENKSTDGTLEWLLLLNDERIRVESADNFLSLEDNWSRISLLDTNDFITIVGHDDLLDPDYLSNVCDLINKYPDASLYQTHFRFIDADGAFLRACMPVCEKLYIHNFIGKQLMRTMNSMGSGYVMRRKDFDAVGGISDYKNLIFGDYELWAKLISIRYLAVSPSECFSYREHASTSVSTGVGDYFSGLSRYIRFLSGMAKENDMLMNVIERYADNYLEYMCEGIIYRGMRVRRLKGYKNADQIVSEFEELRRLLVPAWGRIQVKRSSLRLAVIVDDWLLLRLLYFLAVKVKGRMRAIF